MQEEDEPVREKRLAQVRYDSTLLKLESDVQKVDIVTGHSCIKKIKIALFRWVFTSFNVKRN